LIKSAVELALERTKHLEVDESSLKASEYKVSGRKAAGRYLEVSVDDAGSAGDSLASAIKAVDPQFSEVFRKAVFDVISAQIQLSAGAVDQEKFARIGAGLGIVSLSVTGKGLLGRGSPEKEVIGLVQQIAAFAGKYQEEVKRVEQAIRTQWAPKLKEKERQLAARMGQDVRLDPMSDPEFAAFYKQNVEALRARYSEALDGAKNELAVLCGIIEAENSSSRE